MSKLNIPFNNKNYNIDESALAAALAELRQHLSTNMSGTGAKIVLDGTAYNIDSSKLSTATAEFVTHLGTVTGNGYKVKVNGVEYSVDANKVSGAVADLEAVLGELTSGSGGSDVGGSDTLYWDGNTEGLNAVGGRYYKVSDVTPSITDLENGSMIFFEHIDEPMPLEFAEVFEGVLMASYSVIIVTEKGVGIDLGGMSFSETGIYFVNDGTSHVKSFTINGYTGFPSTPSEPTEELLEGDGQEFHKFAPTALTFRSTAPLNELQEVQINGVTVDPSNYTLEEGSTVVTLPIEYLKTLDVDNYEITVVSDSKSAKGGFSVVEPELNEHGFYYNQPYVANVQGYGNVALFYRENGVLDFIIMDNEYIESGSFTVTGNTVVNNVSLGSIPATLSSNSTEIQCDALGVTFKLGDESVAADNDYIYLYKESFGGYGVRSIDQTKASYGVIKTDIYGKPTVALLESAFEGKLVEGEDGYDVNISNLSSIPEMPDSITYIGRYAFRHCYNLTNVVIPDGVSIIEYMGFADCTSMISVTIPDSVTNFDTAFYGCRSLNDIIFEGTMSQWNDIIKSGNWNQAIPATHVQCSDGQVSLV